MITHWRKNCLQLDIRIMYQRQFQPIFIVSHNTDRCGLNIALPLFCIVYMKCAWLPVPFWAGLIWTSGCVLKSLRSSSTKPSLSEYSEIDVIPLWNRFQAGSCLFTEMNRKIRRISNWFQWHGLHSLLCTFFYVRLTLLRASNWLNYLK